jgi:hypothetical protein
VREDPSVARAGAAAGGRVTLLAPTPTELLNAADELLSAPRPASAGWWPKAVALLTRQALERSMEALWLSRAPEVAAASKRSQLLCLRSYIDRGLALRAGAVWGALSRACHDHPYELPPTAAELAGWFETTERLVQAVQRAERGAAAKA